jgi:hypothetical protein
MPEDVRPHLDPATVADDAALTKVIDALFAEDAEVAEQVGQIAMYYLHLGETLPPDAWKVVLACHEKEAALVRCLVGWAFHEGRRYPAGTTRREKGRDQ